MKVSASCPTWLTPDHVVRSSGWPSRWPTSRRQTIWRCRCSDHERERMSSGSRGSSAIVGVGQTEFSKAAGRSETQLASEAIVAALGDAGLAARDIDGLVSYTIDPVEETELVRALGIPE